MAAIAKTGTPSLATVGPEAGDVLAGNIRAGEDLAAYDACYIASTGLAMRATGAAANAAAKVRGYAAEACKNGEAVTLYKNVRVRYGAGLTPGTDVFLSGATPGGLDSAASTGGTAPIGFIVDDTRIHLWESRY